MLLISPYFVISTETHAFFVDCLTPIFRSPRAVFFSRILCLHCHEQLEYAKLKVESAPIGYAYAYVFFLHCLVLSAHISRKVDVILPATSICYNRFEKIFF